MKKGLSSRFHLALGLSMLIVSVLLTALWLGLIPDAESARRAGRIALAETLAMGSTSLMDDGVAAEDDPRLARLLAFALRRNPELLSIGLRHADGTLAAAAGPHAVDGWPAAGGGGSDLAGDTRIEVPIAAGAEAWGRIELRFQALRQPLFAGAPAALGIAPPLLLIAAVCVASFVVFYVYLRRMLRHLDPSKVVPGRVRTAFDTLAEGVVVVDAEARIVLVNRAFAQVGGGGGDGSSSGGDAAAAASALVGTSVSALPWRNQAGARMHPADMPWTASLADAEVRRNVLMYLADARQQRLAFMVNCSPVPGAGGIPAGVLISFDDVTELEEKEIELRLARDEADSANQAKSDFLANMSHEIRTPMNAILGYTELMRRGYQHSAADAARYLDIIHGSGRHLLELINDILDLSKVEAGRLDVERIGCAVHAVVRDVVRSMAVKADEKGVSLRVVFPEALPASVLTDPSRLRQIITNLIGNGLKFTERGGVTLTVRMQPRGDSVGGAGAGTGGERDLIAIDIADTGIGIASDKLDAIFEPFVQAEASTTRNFGGTGLGLAISRRFARALGGDVVASSEPGRGSTFRVTIEAGALDGVEWLSPQQLEALPEAEPAAGGAAWRFEPARVLVVDDGVENRQLVRLVLEAAGLGVVEAENGAVALEVVAAGDVDLVLMDVQMPVMDGYAATRILRERGVRIPVVALTANAMKGFQQQIAEAGFSAYLTKPVDIDAMLAELANHLRGRQVEAGAGIAGASAVVDPPVPVPTPVAAEAAPEREDQTTEPIHSRLAQHPRLRRVARNFALQLPARLLTMRRAVDGGDLTELAALAHWLKGAGGTVGFDALFEPAVALERAAKDADGPAAEAALAELDRLMLRLVIPEDSPAAVPA